MKKYILNIESLLFVTLLFSACIASAQTDGLRPEEVITITDYSPEIADAVKQNFPADIPQRTVGGKLDLIYSTPARLLQLPFAPTPLKPIAIGAEKPEKYPMSYFKAGFGTQFSPLFEALWNDGKYEKHSYGAFFRHFSSYGQKINRQDYSENYLSVFANKFTKKARMNTELSYHRDGLLYYGYQLLDDTTEYARKEVKQHFNSINWTAGITNIKTNKDFEYDVKVGFGFFGDKNKIRETDPWVNINMSKIFRSKHYVTLKIAEDFIRFKNQTSVTRNIFTVKPVYEFNDKVWKIFGGVDLTWENKIFHLFPELGLERSLYDNYIVLYNGWRMELNKTTYQSLTDENPWLRSEFELKHNWHEDRYMALKGTVKDFSYNVRFAQRVIRRMPLFVNDTLDMKRFEVIYDRRTNVLNFHAELFYHATQNLNFSATFDFFHYEMDIVDQAWHLPSFKIDFNTQYSIKKKVYLTLNLFVRDGVKARLPGNETLDLKPTADINLGATYKFSKHFSFFCNLNNLAAIKYQKYYLYPSYGFNMMAGAIFHY